MNNRTYALGLAYVCTAMAASVVVRSFADASVIAAYGAARLPHFLVAWTLALAALSAGYGALARRLHATRLDPALLASSTALSLFARRAADVRGPAAFAALAAAVALGSFANLLAWNAVAATVRGRAARRLLPRAGAVATAGAAAAGLAASALADTLGSQALPPFAAALSVAALGCALVLAPHVSNVPQALPPRGASPGEAPRALVRWLAAVALAEATAGAVADYQFKSALASAFGRNGTAPFIAGLYGVTNLGVLVLQWAVVPTVLATRRLESYALLHPALMFLAFLGGAAWPGLLPALVSRVSDGVLKFALSRPGQEVSLSALPPGEPARWKVILRGGVSQAGAALAGLALIVAMPFARGAPTVAIVGLVAATLWLVAARGSVRAYVAAVAQRLGVRRAGSRTPRTPRTAAYRDRLAALVALASGGDAGARDVAAAVVSRAAGGAGELVPFLGLAGPAARAGLFALAARRPERAAVPALAAAVDAERDEAALAAGLAALAAHGHAGASARARECAGAVGALGVAARGYLAQVGGLSGNAADAAVREVLARDGVWAARIASAREPREHGALRGLSADVERALSNALDGESTEAVRCALASLETLTVPRFERLARERRAAFAVAVTEADAQALPRLALFARASTDGTVRARWAAGLSRNESDAARGALTDLLTDGEARVRAVAARALSRQLRRRGALVPARAVEIALESEVETFERYLATRALAGARPVLHETEIARRCEQSLGRVLALAALRGRPTVVHAAERRLRSGNEAERKGALDLLQEVLAVDARARVVSAVERWASGVVAPTVDDRAAALACEQDPWLGQLLAGAFDDCAVACAALRASPAAAGAWGESVVRLARAATAVRCAGAQREGLAGGALLVSAGELRVPGLPGYGPGEWLTGEAVVEASAGSRGAEAWRWDATLVSEVAEDDAELRAGMLQAEARRARAAWG